MTALPPITRLVVRQLGRIGYKECFELQQKLQAERIAGKIQDTLLLVEHPPVFTTGRRGESQDVLWDPEYCESRGIELVRTNRGGLVTCHAPGQLVGYPIVDVQAMHRRLNPSAKGEHIRWFVNRLGSTVVGALQGIGVEQAVYTACPPERVGVWVGLLKDRKICSIGLQVRRWISMHGFAVNVNNDLHLFDGIVPCGIDGRPMTSIQRELQHFAHEHTPVTNPIAQKGDQDLSLLAALAAEQIRPEGAPTDRSDITVDVFTPHVLKSFEDHFGVECVLERK